MDIIDSQPSGPMCKCTDKNSEFSCAKCLVKYVAEVDLNKTPIEKVINRINEL